MAQTYPDPLPVRTTTFNPATIPQPLKHNFTESIQFLGYDYQPDPEQAIINLTLFWKSRQRVDENYRVQVQLVDPAGESHFTWLSHPVNGLYPTRAWDPGDVIRDALPLPLAGVPATTYQIQIDLLPEAEYTSLTGEPFQFIQFELQKQQPIPNAQTFNQQLDYRLWTDDSPARQRQTVALSWLNTNPKSEIQNPKWTLVGPDNVPRPPVATGDATAIFIVAGHWPSGDYRLSLPGGESTITPVLAVANPERLFALPPQIETEPGWTRVEANFSNQIELIGYALPSRRVEPGGGLPLTLYWRSLAPALPNAVTFAVLLNAGQQPYGSVDRFPSGFYSPMLWAEGEVVPDSFTLAVSPQAPPGVYQLHVGQYRQVDQQPRSLPLVRNGQPIDDTAVVIGPIKVGGPPPGVVAQQPNPQVDLNQPFGNQITLLGYSLTDDAGQPLDNLKSKIQNLKLSLYWQANTALETDYTTFVHLRNAADETVAQKDSPPAGGQYPTSLWDAGEIIVDEIVVPLTQTPEGKYTPVVGLYNPATAMRLPVTGHPANEVRLQPVNLENSTGD